MSNRVLKRLGFVPIPALVLIIALLYYAVRPSVFYDPAWLIPITNTLFITVVCFAVAWIALRNYRATGRIQILLLGCGVLIFGIGGAIAGFVRGLPDGANLNVTVYNTGALVGALFHFAAAMVLVAGVSPEVGAKKKGIWLAAGYLGVILFMTLLTAASFRGAIPPFFIQGKGPTLLRQAILGSADVLFAFSFLIFLATYMRNREDFLYWYSLALALTSISLTAFFIQHSVGSPVGWAGRCSQYLGGIYFLVALSTAIRSAAARKTTLDSIFTASLSPAEEKFRALAENSPDIIDRFDREFRHIYLNRAGLGLHGKPAHAVIGKTIEETGIAEEYRILWQERIRQVFDTGRDLEVEDYLPDPDGRKFYHSRCVPEFGSDGSVANVLVVSRDLTEHKAAEAQIERLNQDLQRRVAELEVILDTSPIGLAIAEDAQGLHIRGNRALEEFTGLPSGGELSLRGAEASAYRVFRDGEEVPMDALPMQRACQGETVTGQVLEIVRSNGTTATLYSSATPLLDGKGQPGGAIGAFMDISEIKQAGEALQQVNAELERRVAEQTAEIRRGYHAVQAERQRFLDVLETLPVIVTLLRPDHRVEWVNRAYRDALGDNVDRLCYESQFGLDKPCVECQAFTPLRSGEPHNWEWTLPNGRTFDIHNFPFADSDGSPLILEMDIDITERRQAEEALKEWNATLERRVAERTAELRESEGQIRDRENELRLVMNTVPALISYIDPEFRYRRVNRNYERWFGLKPEEMEGRHIREVLGDTIWEIVMPYQQRALSGETVTYEAEMPYSQGPRWVSTTLVPDLGPDGTVRGLVALVTDITDRKRTEEEIRKSLQEKEVLLKEIHHRVKNNMQVISSLVSLQAGGFRDEKVREALKDITDRVRSMALVHEKLYQSADLASIDFAEYIRSLLNFLWRSHGDVASSVRLNLDLQPLSLPVDTAVPCGLILNELVGNALKHAFTGRSGGEVTVSLKGAAGERISLGVSDNGVGLPEGLDWRQACSLGLRLVQMLAGQIGADVRATSGEGTRFEIAFNVPE